MRVTEKQLKAICSRINDMTGNPEAPYTKGVDGRMRANIGNYHIDHAYGGVSLHQMQTEGGGIRDVFSCGHVPKRDLADRMYAFINGLESCK